MHDIGGITPARRVGDLALEGSPSTDMAIEWPAENARGSGHLNEQSEKGGRRVHRAAWPREHDGFVLVSVLQRVVAWHSQTPLGTQRVPAREKLDIS